MAAQPGHRPEQGGVGQRDEPHAGPCRLLHRPQDQRAQKPHRGERLHRHHPRRAGRRGRVASQAQPGSNQQKNLVNSSTRRRETRWGRRVRGESGSKAGGGTSPKTRTNCAPPKTTATLRAPSASEHLNIVIVGHVDHGKSTLLGRLYTDTGSLPDGKLDKVREICRRQGKEFEYAFLFDAFLEEQEQGITIDTARTFFKWEGRHYIIIDAPGHKEFLKNMVSGAARAEAALLVIDAYEGV